MVNIRHRPGSVGVYRIAAERYLLPLASLYSLRLEQGAVKRRSAETSLLPALYPPCSTVNPPAPIVPSFTLKRVMGSYATFIAPSSRPLSALYLAWSHSACEGSN